MAKLGGFLLCLVFAIPFGGVGAFATWAIGKTALEAWQARDWVRVKATVEQATLEESRGSKGGATYRAEGSYAYVFQGVRHTGSRLGIGAMGGSDNIDDWHHEVNGRLEEARSSGRPITVWVDPDEPSRAVFDRDIRWKQLLFLVPFSLAFGGVGVGALVAGIAVLRGGDAAAAKPKPAAKASPRREGEAQHSQGGPMFFWIFAFFWNALSFPIALLAVPAIIADRNWPGLLVLLFPLVGLGLLWAAIAATWQAWKSRGTEAAPAATARSVPGKFAAQAARAMFDPGLRPGARVATEPAVAIEPSLAQVEEAGGTLTVRYSRRRRLGLAVVTFACGAIATAIAVLLLLDEGLGVGTVILLAVASLLDLGAVSLVAGSLVVRARAGELVVEQRGLRGARSWKLSPQEIREVRPMVSYTVNDRPYFTLQAHTISGEQVPLGNSLPGTELTDALARRIARAAGIDAGRLRGAQGATAAYATGSAAARPRA